MAAQSNGGPGPKSGWHGRAAAWRPRARPCRARASTLKSEPAGHCHRGTEGPPRDPTDSELHAVGPTHWQTADRVMVASASESEPRSTLALGNPFPKPRRLLAGVLLVSKMLR
jgi:hypothetical protein